MNKYYVYIYFEPDTGIPFYVGKGSGNRAHQHLKEAFTEKNKTYHKNRYIRELVRRGKPPIVKIVEFNVDEATAYEFESFLIQTIGTQRHKTGPLTNYHDGTENIKFGPYREKKSSGRCMKGELNPRYGVKLSDEQKQKFKQTISLRPEDWQSKLKGRLKSDDTKKKLSDVRVGKVFCNGPYLETHLAKISKLVLHYNEKPPVSIPYGVKSANGKMMTYARAYAKEYAGLYGMTPNGIHLILTGKNVATVNLLDDRLGIKIKSHD